MGFVRDLFFGWQPDKDAFVAPLRIKKSLKIRFDRFPKGINNQQIDVALSPGFVDSSRHYIRQSMYHEVMVNCWGKSTTAPEADDVQALCSAYSALMEFAVDKARKLGRIESVQLVQLSVMKLFFQQVESEFLRLKNQLKHEQGRAHNQSSGSSMKRHDRLV